MKEVRKNHSISAPEIRLTARVEYVCKDTVLRVIIDQVSSMDDG